MRKYLLFFICFVFFSFSVYANDKGDGGFSLSKTRVIYNSGDSSQSFYVINSTKDVSFLAQSWITDYLHDGNASNVTITPPLYKQVPGRNMLKVMMSGVGLPQDRESAYWINVKAIPSTARNNGNAVTIKIAYVLRVKLFYRPKGVAGDPLLAYKALRFINEGKVLKVINPTPYYISLNELSVGGVKVKNLSAMVPPKGEVSYNLDSEKVGSVKYSTINDYGVVTPVVEVSN
ncbi:molecular chaperone [Salmonella enterica]|nr:molecular chaperone [Salmonella enterica]EGM2645796.1 molecular chaperone [Salmonella enterica]EGM2983892.1 molecular chaperone [Salmonella enterica]EJU6033413.1 molecular chaperone [Salmonella enterica]